MEKRQRVRIIIGAMINIIVFGLSIFCLCNFIGYIIKGSPDNRFRYFTNLSTIMVGLIALPNAILLFLSAIKRKMLISTVFSVFKYVGLSMIALTFFTVLFFIAPLTSYKEMYQNMRFITHLVIPLLVIVSYLFFEENVLFNWKLSLIGVVPSVIYTIVYGVNVPLLKTWPDIYKVNNNGLWFLFAFITIIFNVAISLGLDFLKKLVVKRLSK